MRKPLEHKPRPGTISISLKHQGGGRITAHYAFPDFEFSECAYDELRSAARMFNELAAEGRHACSQSWPCKVADRKKRPRPSDVLHRRNPHG